MMQRRLNQFVFSVSLVLRKGLAYKLPFVLPDIRMKYWHAMRFDHLTWQGWQKKCAVGMGWFKMKYDQKCQSIKKTLVANKFIDNPIAILLFQEDCICIDCHFQSNKLL